MLRYSRVMMRTREVEVVRPLPALAPFIESLRVLRPLPEQVVQRVERLPDGTTTLLFRRSHEAAVSSSPSEVRPADLCVAGPRRRALFKAVRPAALTLSITFTPGGASAFFGVPARDLTDRVVGLDDVWPGDGERLREALTLACDPYEMLDRLQQALVARARVASEGPSPLVQRAVRLLRDREQPPRLRDLAGALGVSDRHLRRTFEAMVGVGPKEFARMMRLQRAVRAATPQTSWTTIAAQAGYYDQAHMIAEFHDLIGATPTAFMQHVSDRASRWASPDCRAL